MVVTYYVNLFRMGADRHNSILMPLLLLVAETVIIYYHLIKTAFRQKTNVWEKFWTYIRNVYSQEVSCELIKWDQTLFFHKWVYYDIEFNIWAIHFFHSLLMILSVFKNNCKNLLYWISLLTMLFFEKLFSAIKNRVWRQYLTLGWR